MSDERTRKVNRLLVLNVVRQNSGLTVAEVTRELDLTRVTTKKHLKNLVSDEYLLQESRKYYLTKKGEEYARFLENDIRGHKWGKNICLPQIMVMATVGLPTCTVIGCDGNAIKNIYGNFKSFVETAKNEGVVFFGTLKASCHRKND